jgi:hypothetical protein
MRLALRTANFCMERNAGAEEEDGKCSQLEYGKVELLQAPLTLPISSWIGVLNSRMKPREPAAHGGHHRDCAAVGSDDGWVDAQYVTSY